MRLPRQTSSSRKPTLPREASWVHRPIGFWNGAIAPLVPLRNSRRHLVSGRVERPAGDGVPQAAHGDDPVLAQGMGTGRVPLPHRRGRTLPGRPRQSHRQRVGRAARSTADDGRIRSQLRTRLHHRHRRSQGPAPQEQTGRRQAARPGGTWPRPTTATSSIPGRCTPR